MTKLSTADVCNTYIAAYKAANSGRYVTCEYFNGWYSIYTGGLSQTKYRRAMVEQMTEELRRRVATNA